MRFKRVSKNCRISIYKLSSFMDFMEIKKVRKQGNLKVITIPLKSNIESGDYVKVVKISEDSA